MSDGKRDSDNRTPDPAVQVVADHLHRTIYDMPVGAIHTEFHSCPCARQAEPIVAALREAGHIKNLRQNGWWGDRAEWHSVLAHDELIWRDCREGKCTPVYTEEGEQR